ncbi:zinc-finger double domain-containing protein [Ditylenchus destructor]|nr:zinc-finger double domain-containing protein [Ditylenchus destructor]
MGDESSQVMNRPGDESSQVMNRPRMTKNSSDEIFLSSFNKRPLVTWYSIDSYTRAKQRNEDVRSVNDLSIKDPCSRNTSFVANRADQASIDIDNEHDRIPANEEDSGIESEQTECQEQAQGSCSRTRPFVSNKANQKAIDQESSAFDGHLWDEHTIRSGTNDPKTIPPTHSQQTECQHEAQDTCNPIRQFVSNKVVQTAVYQAYSGIDDHLWINYTSLGGRNEQKIESPKPFEQAQCRQETQASFLQGSCSRTRPFVSNKANQKIIDQTSSAIDGRLWDEHTTLCGTNDQKTIPPTQSQECQHESQSSCARTKPFVSNKTNALQEQVSKPKKPSRKVSKKVEKDSCARTKPFVSNKINALQDQEPETSSRNKKEFKRERTYKCSLCSYATAYSSCLQDHNNTHTGEKPYKCDLCSFISATQRNLTAHVRTHTGQTPYRCAVCSYTCAQPHIMKAHIRLHTGERPFKCNRCSYATRLASSLRQHLRSHTGEKPYKCGYCAYASNHSGVMRQHIRTHTGEKPYKCHMCSYASVYKNHLTLHVRRHTGERPYKCHLCPYSSARRVSMQDHARIHSGEKPYKCLQCNYATARLNEMKTHALSHLEEKPFMQQLRKLFCT